MKSIGARMAAYYAAAATASAALLLVTGYLLLESRLIHGLDELNAAEFRQLTARLGPDYRALTPKMIEDRIGQTADAASALFFINVDVPKSGLVFESRNLKSRPIPDVKGLHQYNALLSGTGEIRVGEFIEPPFDVSIATPMAQVRASMRSYVEVCVALLIAMLLASVAIGFRFAGILLRPLVYIRETAIHIGSDNLSERIPVSDHQDELSDLVELLNAMFDRLERSFTQIKRFSAEASHELKTPLSLIRLHGEKLLEDESLSAQAVEAIEVQLEEVERLNQIIEAMLFLSRAEAKAIQLDLQPLDPQPLLQGFEQDAQALAEHSGRRFVLEMSGSGRVALQGRWLRQVWLNLLTNAIRVTPEGGLVTMSTWYDQSQWHLALADEGPGLPEDQLEKIFEPFTQFGPLASREKGSGLGLAIVRSIVHLHSGSVEVRNRQSHTGLIVTVSLPCMPNTA